MQAQIGKGILDQRFAIIGQIGKGGTASVKLGVDTESSEKVAIKVMKDFSEETIKQL